MNKEKTWCVIAMNPKPVPGEGTVEVSGPYTEEEAQDAVKNAGQIVPEFFEPDVTLTAYKLQPSFGVAWERERLAAQDRVIERVRELMRPLGYAVGVHGSRARDLDLIAAPWVEEAEPDRMKIVEALQAEGSGFVVGMGQKAQPHNRLGIALHGIPGAAKVKYVDLSVLLPAERACAADEAKDSAFGVGNGRVREEAASPRLAVALLEAEKALLRSEIALQRARARGEQEPSPSPRPYRLQLPGNGHAWSRTAYGSVESAEEAAKGFEEDPYHARHFRDGPLRIIDRRTGANVRAAPVDDEQRVEAAAERAYEVLREEGLSFLTPWPKVGEHTRQAMRAALAAGEEKDG